MHVCSGSHLGIINPAALIAAASNLLAYSIHMQ
jgi:hypothetical protein